MLQLQHLSDANPDRVNLQLIRMKLVTLVSESMRRKGKPDEARKLCEALLKDAARPLQDIHDNRDVARTVAGLIAEKGRSELELQDFAAAEASLRDAMSRLRRSFFFDGTPKEFSFAYMKNEATHDQMEPKAFVKYALIQSSLAKILWKTNRIPLACNEADEAVRTCLAATNLFPELPTFGADMVECMLTLLAIDNIASSLEKPRFELAKQVATNSHLLINDHKLPPRRFATNFLYFEGDNRKWKSVN